MVGGSYLFAHQLAVIDAARVKRRAVQVFRVLMVAPFYQLHDPRQHVGLVHAFGGQGNCAAPTRKGFNSPGDLCAAQSAAPSERMNVFRCNL